MSVINNDLLEKIIKKIPSFELSYEEKVHKKVRSDLCFALPYGTKSLFWFIFVENSYLCISIPLKGTKLMLNKSKVETACFDKTLCYGNGTLCLGTKINKTNVVILYDVLYYKNMKYFSSDHYDKKLKLLQMLTNNIDNNIVLSYQLSFFLPQYAENFNQLYEKIKHQQYTNYCCMFVDLYIRNEQNINIFKSYLLNSNNNTYEKIFVIQPSKDASFDMYDLYIYSNGSFEYYEKAHVNNLKVSYELNKYFNNYKYVDNLDCIEESDDDTEEYIYNNNDNKQLHNHVEKKHIYAKCIYNKYLKLWEPNEIIVNKPKYLNVVTRKELNNIY
jgi:hypothetical protein